MVLAIQNFSKFVGSPTTCQGRLKFSFRPAASVRRLDPKDLLVAAVKEGMERKYIGVI